MEKHLQVWALDDLLVHDVYDILTEVIIFPVEFIFVQVFCNRQSMK